MRTIKTYLVLALLAFCLSGCESGIVPEHGYIVTYHIDNTNASHGYYIEIESAEPGALDNYQLPAQAYMQANQSNKWVSTDFPYNTVVDKYGFYDFVFSFYFGGGIKHTFTGDMIENDIRDINSWKTVEKEYEYRTEITYTYTFTDEDYERIMALHK